MTRTSRPDSNYLSYSGDTVQLYMGTNSVIPVYPPYKTELMPVFPQDWDAILKVSANTSPISLSNMRIAQGRENAIDINNEAHDIYIVGQIGFGGGEGDQIITVKGGSSCITIAGTLCSRGRKADVIVGAWSDQSIAKSHSLDFSGLARSDGEPITVIFGRADRSTILLPSNAKILFWASLGEVIYWWAKRAYVAIRY